MMMKCHRILFCLMLCTVLPAFSLQRGEVTVEQSATTASVMGQPDDERKVQDNLPIAKDSLWTVFAKTKVSMDADKSTYKAAIPDDIKKMVGEKIKISGFILPLETTEKFKHFLLSKRTPTCAFCPPGSPNEIIEVYTDEPIAWLDELVTFEGVFSLIDNQEMGVFFEMKKAKEIK